MCSRGWTLISCVILGMLFKLSELHFFIGEAGTYHRELLKGLTARIDRKHLQQQAAHTSSIHPSQQNCYLCIWFRSSVHAPRSPPGPSVGERVVVLLELPLVSSFSSLSPGTCPSVRSPALTSADDSHSCLQPLLTLALDSPRQHTTAILLG